MRAGKSTAMEDFARYSVEDAQDAAAAGKDWRGTRRDAAAGEGTRSSGARENTL